MLLIFTKNEPSYFTQRFRLPFHPQTFLFRACKQASKNQISNIKFPDPFLSCILHTHTYIFIQVTTRLLVESSSNQIKYIIILPKCNCTHPIAAALALLSLFLLFLLLGEGDDSPSRSATTSSCLPLRF